MGEAVPQGREDAVHHRGRENTVFQARRTPFVKGERTPFVKGERTPFVEGHRLSREGHSLSTREGERCKSTREDENKVVGRKNNEFPC